MSEAGSFSRVMERTPGSKKFTSMEVDVGGFSDRERMAGDINYDSAKINYNKCLASASQYFLIMRKRLEEESPDYFADKGTTAKAFER